MKIRFESSTHQYFDETGRELISVTALLKRHNLSPNYSGISEEVLNAKSQRGTMIHEEISNFVKTGVNDGITNEAAAYAEWSEENGVFDAESETIVNNNYLAGTVDLMFCCGNGSVIADIKTTAHIHHDYCAWQLSLYEYLSGRSFDKLLVLHAIDDKIKPIDLTAYRKPKVEIEKLIKSDALMNVYTPPVPTLPKQELSQIIDAEKLIKRIKQELATAEAVHQKLKDALMNAMLDKGVKSFENDTLKITYLAATTRESIDSKTLKANLPEIAKQYTKISTVAPSIRITVKEQINNEQF